MQICSVCKKLQIVPGCLYDYRQLAHYHYRDGRLGPFTAIFALKTVRSAGTLHTMTVGVIVYSTPSPRLQLRHVAMDNFFAGFDTSTQLALINKNIRSISRVIIEPRFRGLGLASRLVRETMPEMNVPIIEAIAVMGLVNPFFEKAGMKAYRAKPPASSVQLIEALNLVGIENAELIDADKVQRKLDRLAAPKARFIELEIRRFLKSHGRRRDMQAGHERTRYVLSKLTARPIYYIWFNPKFNSDRWIPDASRESGKERR